MNNLRIGLMSAALVAGLASTNAQTVAADSVMQHVNGKRLSVGGYGEVALSRNFYSDHVSRYSLADEHKKDPSHGRFDIPHGIRQVSVSGVRQRAGDMNCNSWQV